MSKVVVDEELVRHPGLRLLEARLRWKPATALGTVVLLRQKTRDAGLREGTMEDILPHLPCDAPHRRGLFDVLVQAGFIRQHNGPFFVIEGNAAYLDLIDKRRAAGKKGRAATTLVGKERLQNRLRAAEPKPPARKPAKRVPRKPASAPAWEAYRAAFTQAYGVEPTRNARVNACLARFVERVGAEDAPAVLAFYVRHTDAMYLRRQHPVTLALQDAEGLHAQWRGGVAVTGRDVRALERTLSTRDQLRRIERGQM